MRRVKELVAENARLKKMYAEVQLQNDIVKEALKKSGKASTTTNRQRNCREKQAKHSGSLQAVNDK